MNINEILLVCAALFPAVTLCIYVFIKDRVEKEPVGLLLVLLALGCFSCLPAARIERVLFDIIEQIFSPFITVVDGKEYMAGHMFRLYNATKYFIGVALVEEGLKFFALFFVTRDNKNFNSLFDGIIYAVFVSLGFAGYENIGYVLRFGWSNAFMRGILSVPGHMFFGVLMGYYYSFWHMSLKAREKEHELKRIGVITVSAPEFSGKRYLRLMLIMPVLAHGFYDYCCTVGGMLTTVGLYVFVLFLYIYCFGKIKRMSRIDTDDNKYSSAMIFKKYPFLLERIREEQAINREN